MIHIWRLSERGKDNLGLCCSEDGLVLGTTPLIERHDSRFVVRERHEIERLLSRAYQADRQQPNGLDVDRLMPGLATVAAALSANDPCLACIAAIHLRLPDLPDHFARSSVEAKDVLIKIRAKRKSGREMGPHAASAHRRAAKSGLVRTHRGIDGRIILGPNCTSVGDRVVLPAGQRNDELADLLQWIANAKPGDEQAIRGEISRRYSDIGSTLNAALDNTLAMGGGYQARQRILDGIEPLSRIDPDADPSTDLLIGAGLLLLGMIPPGAAVEAGSAAWELGWAARELYFSEQLGADLPATFRTIDSFSNGITTSIKSIDLNAAMYQDIARLTYRLNDYIDKMALYEGGQLGAVVIKSSDISGRALSLAIPKGSMTVTQQTAFEAARARAEAFGIYLTVTSF